MLHKFAELWDRERDSQVASKEIESIYTSTSMKCLSPCFFLGRYQSSVSIERQMLLFPFYRWRKPLGRSCLFFWCDRAKLGFESFVSLTPEHLHTSWHPRQPSISCLSFLFHIWIQLGWEGSVSLLKSVTVIFILTWPTEFKVKCPWRQQALLMTAKGW